MKKMNTPRSRMVCWRTAQLVTHSLGGNSGLSGGRWHTPTAAKDYEESMKMYKSGLRHVRTKRYPSARRILSQCAARHPTFERAWVTLAQMEKKVDSREKCESILKSGLLHNPRSGAILQAWGLHLLQEEDHRCDLMAYGLLRASVDMDPKNKNVLKWSRVREIGRRWRQIRQKARRARRLRAAAESEAATVSLKNV